jgi:hypothetical protein
MKTLSATLAALSLAFAAGSAMAAPVALSFQQTDADGYAADLFSGAPGDFSDFHNFVLSGDVALSGQIKAVIVDAGPSATTPYLDIQSAYLKSVTSGQRIDLVQTVGFDWANGFSGTEVWTLSPVLLTAGEWTLYVSGVGINDKGADGYDATFNDIAGELPEPAALALVATALAALALSRRRRGA